VNGEIINGAFGEGLFEGTEEQDTVKLKEQFQTNH
jgi:hypothetical protein